MEIFNVVMSICHYAFLWWIDNNSRTHEFQESVVNWIWLIDWLPTSWQQKHVWIGTEWSNESSKRKQTCNFTKNKSAQIKSVVLLRKSNKFKTTTSRQQEPVSQEAARRCIPSECFWFFFFFRNKGETLKILEFDNPMFQWNALLACSKDFISFILSLLT